MLESNILVRHTVILIFYQFDNKITVWNFNLKKNWFRTNTIYPIYYIVPICLEYKIVFLIFSFYYYIKFLILKIWKEVTAL